MSTPKGLGLSGYINTMFLRSISYGIMCQNLIFYGYSSLVGIYHVHPSSIQLSPFRHYECSYCGHCIPKYLSPCSKNCIVTMFNSFQKYCSPQWFQQRLTDFQFFQTTANLLVIFLFSFFQGRVCLKLLGCILSQNPESLDWYMPPCLALFLFG